MMNLILLQLSSGCFYRRQHQTLPCALVMHSTKMRNNRHKLQQRKFQSYINIHQGIEVICCEIRPGAKGGCGTSFLGDASLKLNLMSWATEQHEQTLKLDLLLVQLDRLSSRVSFQSNCDSKMFSKLLSNIAFFWKASQTLMKPIVKTHLF